MMPSLAGGTSTEIVIRVVAVDDHPVFLEGMVGIADPPGLVAFDDELLGPRPLGNRHDHDGPAIGSRPMECRARDARSVASSRCAASLSWRAPRCDIGNHETLLL